MSNNRKRKLNLLKPLFIASKREPKLLKKIIGDKINKIDTLSSKLIANKSSKIVKKTMLIMRIIIVNNDFIISVFLINALIFFFSFKARYLGI